MISKKTQGIVLYNRNYRESDQLVKIFTETDGKRMFFVRNARKSKLLSVIQPLTVAHFIVKLNQNGLSYIDDYYDVQNYRNINQDIFKLAYATYLIALSDAAIPDNQHDAALFSFLKKALDLIANDLDCEVVTFIFEIQLLQRFGVQLNFDDCSFCHQSKLPFDFSFRYSGVLCPNHYGKDEKRCHLDPNIIYLISRFQSISFDDLRKISLNKETKTKLRQFIDALYDNYVGIHLKSKTFIDKLESWGNLMT